MINYENLINNPDYYTDSGDAEKSDIFSNGQIKLGNQSGSNAISIKEAFSRIENLQGKPMLLIKTSKYGKKPGAFYAKAFISKGVNWNNLIKVLKKNQTLGKYSNRKAWVCAPNRKWN